MPCFRGLPRRDLFPWTCWPRKHAASVPTHAFAASMAPATNQSAEGRESMAPSTTENFQTTSVPRSEFLRLFFAPSPFFRFPSSFDERLSTNGFIGRGCRNRVGEQQCYTAPFRERNRPMQTRDSVDCDRPGRILLVEPWVEWGLRGAIFAPWPCPRRQDGVAGFFSRQPNQRSLLTCVCATCVSSRPWA